MKNLWKNKKYVAAADTVAILGNKANKEKLTAEELKALSDAKAVMTAIENN